jgi:Carbohydrate family 9 binding domain-like
VEAPDVVLAEGAPMMGGDGFEKLWPSAEKVAVGGTNPILVDRVGAQLLGLWDRADLAKELGGHRTSPLLEAAAKRFGVDIASPAVTGDGAALVSGARPVHFVAMASFTILSDATPALPPAAIATLGSPAAPTPAPTAAGGPRPVVHAAALGNATIVLDGRGADAAWSKATAVTFDTDTTGEATGIVTHARFLHGPSGLYGLWELERAGLSTDRTRPTDVPRAKLYDEDCVEMFFTPDPAHPKRYLETEIGPFGHFLDVSVDREAHTSSTAWSSRAHIATTQDAAAHRATIEAELTAPEIVQALTSGAHLPFALYRMEGKSPDRHYLAWSPPRTAHPDFHVPEAFGTLVVDP